MSDYYRPLKRTDWVKCHSWDCGVTLMPAFAERTFGFCLTCVDRYNLRVPLRVGRWIDGKRMHAPLPAQLKGLDEVSLG